MKNLLLVFVLLVSGCATAASSGSLGNVEFRKFVVLGEQIPENIAGKYSDKFDARVFYTPNRGPIASGIVKGLIGTMGPSSAMKSLMNEFRSMSNTSGEWEIIVPEIAERYVLVTLRNMEEGAVANTRGEFYLCDSRSNQSFEEEVKRVFGQEFNVKFGKE